MPWKERIANARDIGVVFGQRTQLWWDLPVQDSFDLLCDLFLLFMDLCDLLLDLDTLCLQSGKYALTLFLLFLGTTDIHLCRIL